jgi:hypothetical protein
MEQLLNDLEEIGKGDSDQQDEEVGPRSQVKSSAKTRDQAPVTKPKSATTKLKVRNMPVVYIDELGNWLPLIIYSCSPFDFYLPLLKFVAISFSTLKRNPGILLTYLLKFILSFQKSYVDKKSKAESDRITAEILQDLEEEQKQIAKGQPKSHVSL